MDDSKKESFDDVTKRMTEEILKTVSKAVKKQTEENTGYLDGYFDDDFIDENTADTSSDNLMDDINESKPDKHVLLAKYLHKNVNAFRQYDCFTNETDSLLDPDKDGDAMCGGNITYELMGGASVRVLIYPEESKQDVIRALLKIAERIDRDGEFKNRTAFDNRDDLPF